MKMFAVLVMYFTYSFCLFAMDVKGSVKSQNFDEAKGKNSKLMFTIESTKVGIFSSDVDGYVLEFSYQGDFDEKNFILRNMELTFPAHKMTTDNEDRDHKLHNLCMEVKNYPEIKVKIQGPVFLKSSRETQVEGKAFIRGKEKPFKATVKPKLQDGKFVLQVKANWSFKAMEIPDPSISIAKVSDDIRLDVQVEHQLK